MCSAEEMFLKLLIRKGTASNIRSKTDILYLWRKMQNIIKNYD